MRRTTHDEHSFEMIHSFFQLQKEGLSYYYYYLYLPFYMLSNPPRRISKSRDILLFTMAAFWAMANRMTLAYRFQATTAFVSSSSSWRSRAPAMRQSIWLLADKNQNENPNGDFEPTWTYIPHDPTKKPATPSPRRRYFSSWTVPKRVDIPEDRLVISFVRSSGAGGQNVNKLSTKVELRFLVKDADWIPREVRDRLNTQQANRINKDGYLSLTSQEYRTQAQNRKAAVAKLEQMLLEAWPRPKVRKQRTGVSKAAKERNKEFKKKRSDTKKNRKQVDW